MSRRLIAGTVCSAILVGCSLWSLTAAEPVASGLFDRKNLVAWCIVPFDSKKRGPEERAAMLKKLGFSKFAYDYRAEHIPTFDAEIEALQRHHVELFAWWFPTVLNDEAKMTLAVFARHKVTPQLWVTGGGAPTKDEADQRARVVAEAARIRPIAEAAARVGCKVALYNHGGWFGEPENQIAIIQDLKLDNVGIVYNQHHGHDHLDRFAELLQKMKPYLYTLNLNGMVKEGDRKGQKILQLGQGDLDLKLLKVVRDSGYTGPIGILGHTQDDAEERLHDNLDGLDWLLPQLSGKQAGPKPKMRTPVPLAAAPAPAPAAVAPTTNKPLVDGKFGQALDGRSGGALVAGREEFHQFPLTIESWTKLGDKSSYNILVANELKSSGTHWEIFSMAGTGNFTAYVPGFAPDHCNSSAMICDNQWHHVAMVLELERIRLYVDGKQVADQPHKRSNRPTEPGGLALGSLVDRAIGCTGLIDEIRISKGVRAITSIPDKPFVTDDATIGLWHLDELTEKKRLDDASAGKNAALLSQAVRPNPPAAGASPSGKIEGHWGEDAIGFRWTEADSRDDRVAKVVSGPFFSGSITGPGGPVYKGIVVRLGDNREASICYDTELMRVAAGWNGFLKFDPARFGVIVPPRIDGEATFSTPRFPGVSLQDQFANFREDNPYGPLPRDVAHYEGLYRQGQRVVLKSTIGNATEVLESPWWESAESVSAITRTLRIGPSPVPIRLQVAEAKAKVRLHAHSSAATVIDQPGIGHVLLVAAHDKPVSIKLLMASSDTNEAAFDQLVAASPAPQDLLSMIKPGPRQWGEPLVTKGEIAPNSAPYVVDTITLPFENPFNALMFCSGHDFLPDGRAVVSMMHGDVWLVAGIDDKLQRITWQRFATGLFQPLGLRVVGGRIYVVGRDQITCLVDLNNDGEADFYENFNNDAQVTLNGHEYVTCLETDRAGNFYYAKGNCNSQTPHDGCLLRVSPDGSRLDVFATGFRNSNGIGMGPNDEITVAPQEGEWTPASGVFLVHEGGFYGGMMSHHRATPPADFERPLVWFPRLADNSSGGQVWTTSDRWGPLANQLLHMSYGQCRLRLVLREDGRAPGTNNGASIELPLRFNSGIHRGRMNPHDGQLYLTGLKGWTTSAVHDGCFQRVRYTGLPLTMPIAMRSHPNGVALTFTGDLERRSAEEPTNYLLEGWNYKWSAAYGSPEFKPSATGQIGRDEVEIKSATLLEDNRTVFLELPDLKPIDQLSVGYTMFARDGQTIDQAIILTLNSISGLPFPETKLHRPTVDPERVRLLASLQPGLLVTVKVGEETLGKNSDRTYVQRMAAWDLKDVSNGTHRPCRVVANGWIRVPVTGRYRFSGQSEPDDLNIILTGAKLTTDGWFALSRGLQPIVVEQYVTGDDASARLMWESDRFPKEAIAPAALMHTPLADSRAVSRFSGAMLFEQLRCANCHQQATVAASRESDNHAFWQIARAAPRLDAIGSRVESTWLAHWIRNPHQLRSDASMPAVIPGDDVGTSNDIAAYLSSLQDPSAAGQRIVVGEDVKADVAESGAELYEQLGCITCHSLAKPDQQDEWNRVSLYYVNAKYRPQALAAYLLAPHSHAPNSRMPDFRLTGAEVSALVQFLRRDARGRLESTGPAGNAERGKAAFEKQRCHQCHVIGNGDALAKPNLPAIRWSGQQATGCLAAQSDPKSKSPRFVLSESEQAALAEFGSGQVVTNLPMGSSRSVDAWMSHLRCTACHSRDAHQSPWSEIIADEGSGKSAETIPHLTWVGEKLQGPWIERLLKGDIKQKSRPWIVARMPSFPAYASLMAHGMAAEHAVPFAEPIPASATAERIELGRRLTERAGGLDCRQCHGVGSEVPRGDKSTQIALGINFSLAKERLRPEFALRQMLDPPRYDPNSRMPRFAPDLKTTAAKGIADGDALLQFQLLKEYLWSID